MKEHSFWSLNVFSPATIPGALLYALLFLVLALVASRLVSFVFRRAMTRDTHGLVDPTVLRFVGQFSQAAVFAFAFLFYTHLVPALNRLGTAWLASVSITSLVIGLAAQQALGNLMAGLSLLLYRPFRIGDIVQMTTPNGVETATVESLSLGYTLLRTEDDRDIVVPNSVMASQVTVNLSRKRRKAVV
ncbi:MAG TPA: mechanosensitive ion channel [Opitutaceae bacterium]|nr:mechanosensitive ion channel [Opitutaceae bacterium]